MTLRGNGWLALTSEETLEPDIPICDPHHHFWVQRPEPVDYQQYLLEHLAADINSGHNVRSTVFVEARSSYRTDGPEEMRSVGEVEFVQAIADAGATGQYGPGKPAHGIVGRADLKLGEAVRPVLEALQEASPNRFRGIRHSVGWDPSPSWTTGRSRAACCGTTTAPAPGCWPTWAMCWKTLFIFRNWMTLPLSPTPCRRSPSS